MSTKLITANPACGHKSTTAVGEPLVCGLEPGHEGLHEQRYWLGDGETMRTNWRDDGKAPWAPEPEAC